jgi:hypothetical protein
MAHIVVTGFRKGTIYYSGDSKGIVCSGYYAVMGYGFDGFIIKSIV